MPAIRSPSPKPVLLDASRPLATPNPAGALTSTPSAVPREAPMPPLPPGRVAPPVAGARGASTLLDVRLGRARVPDKEEGVSPLVGILASPQLAYLAPSERDGVLELYRSVDESARPALAALVQADRNGQPLLLDPGPWRQTLLEHLLVLAREQPAEPVERAGITREKLLSAAVQELADPSTIAPPDEAPGLATCAALQQVLAMRDPGRYANLLAGVSGETGSVALKQNGFLERSPQTVKREDLSAPASRLLQDALFSYVQREVEAEHSLDAADTLAKEGPLDVAQTFERGALAGLTALFGKSRAFTPSEESATAFLRGLEGERPGSALLLVEDAGRERVALLFAVRDDDVTLRFVDGGERRVLVDEAATSLRAAARTL